LLKNNEIGKLMIGYMKKAAETKCGKSIKTIEKGIETSEFGEINEKTSNYR